MKLNSLLKQCFDSRRKIFNVLLMALMVLMSSMTANAGSDDLVVDFGTGSGLWRWMNNSSWQQLHGASAKTMVSGDLDGNGGDIGRIWVHVSHMGNAVQTIQIGGVYIVPTAHMELIDARGARLHIEPWGCIYTGGEAPGAPLPYSAWKIDRVSTTPPTQEVICYVDYLGNPRSTLAWYPVDIPSGFRPVQYVAGCSIYLPFDFL